jgi:hypothetical protein
MSDETERQQQREDEARRQAQADRDRQLREAREEELNKVSKALLGDDKKPDYPDDSDDA